MDDANRPSSIVHRLSSAVRRPSWPTLCLRAAVHLAIYALAGTMVVPFLWMVSTSLKAEQQVFSARLELIPWHPRWANYADAWRIAPFGRYFLNTALVAFSVTGVSLTLNSMAAYAFARLRFPGREPLFLLLLATMMIPFQVTMIPTFLILKQLGWLDSYLGLTVPGFAGAFGIFLLRQFMISVPQELLDAGRIDGASELRIYRRIVLPLCKPALATLATFTFMGAWNDFLLPLIVVKSDEMRTLTLAVAALSSGLYVMSWPLMMAAATFVIMPVLIAFLFAQRFFTRSIVLGGLK
jgi:multiple sugar transport system permease protein